MFAKGVVGRYHRAAAKGGGVTNDVVDSINSSGLFEVVRFKLFVE
jgi:hypothetical protein